jgi:hypothetical protein
VDKFLHDLRYALRLIRRAPGAAMVALLTIAVGVGANAAIFSIIRAVLLAPPPFRNPERLVCACGVFFDSVCAHERR